MAHPATFSSSSFSNRWSFDVFLSFRGHDTRHGFTGHLYKALSDRGIRTFIDDEKLHRGDEILPALVNEIQDSRIAIIVFSKNYASSSFCLDELSTIIHSVKGEGRLVLPVFYDVDPSDVRHQRGSYGEALAKHEQRFKDDIDKVSKWRMAMCDAANLSGVHFKHGDEYEYQVIRRIVELVSSKIAHVPLRVEDHSFGLESRVLEVKSLLKEGSDDGVHMVGIYGMGGVGKTTLALAVFNSIADQFEGSCFLANVREKSSRMELVHLQETLLNDIVGNKYDLQSVEHGISIIKDELHQKKVLLVLDDVDSLEQLESLVGESDWFGPSSRVIVTTRDRHLLTFHGIQSIYEANLLNESDSLELLKWSAFRSDQVDPGYESVLNRAVAACAGLPLALRVIGSSLFGRSIDSWESVLAKLKSIPHSQILDVLRLSFDSLSDRDQEVFLDIACFFNGYELEYVQGILYAHHGYNMEYSIDVLIEKSLMMIDEYGHVILHDLIQDMGREIVRQESPEEPGKRSRLWFSKEIVHVLKTNTGTGNINIILLDFPKVEEVTWDGKAFEKMNNLKTLIIRKGHFSKAPIHLPNSLSVLEWWDYPSSSLPSTFHPQNLAMLKLLNSQFMSPKLVDLPKISQKVHQGMQSGRVPVNSQNVPQEMQTSGRVPQEMQTPYEGIPPVNPQNVPEEMHTSSGGFPPVMPQSSHGVLKALKSWIWRLVGIASTIVGLLCNAWSPSFKRLIGGWSCFKYFLYGLLALVICATMVFAKQSSNSVQHMKIKICVGFVVLMATSVYSFFYDKAVGGRPEILSLVSNGAFALMSLSLSKVIKFGFEMGIFCFFLNCLAVQLVTINLKLILVAIIYGFPLFIVHSPLYSKKDVQVVHFSSNSEEDDNNV